MNRVWRITLGVLMLAFVVGAGTVQAKCPVEYKDRTPGQTISDLYIDFSAQNWERYACNYSKNAFIIDDQGVLVGRDDIVAAAMSLASLFNGVGYTQKQVDVFERMGRVLWSLDAGWVTIPDGISSFHFNKKGKIRRQTSHGLIVFTGPPPDPS